MAADRLLATRLQMALGLPGGAPADARPMDFDIDKQQFRAYLWTCTPDKSAPGERPAGEHKIQLILPGQAEDERGFLSFENGVCTVLLGYCPDLGLFVGWEGRKHAEFAYSANVQIPREVLDRAQHDGWAADIRPLRLKRTSEVRVAMAPWNVMHFLKLYAAADGDGLEGAERLAFFRVNVPNPEVNPPLPENPVVRARVLAARAARDRRFSKAVRSQFQHSCAICKIQLGVVEAAHIVPLSEPDSADKPWNGLALCPTHHRLFDSHLILVSGALEVLVDADRLHLLRQSELGGGSEVIEALDGQQILRPESWLSPSFRRYMCDALERRIVLARGSAS